MQVRRTSVSARDGFVIGPLRDWHLRDAADFVPFCVSRVDEVPEIDVRRAKQKLAGDHGSR